MILLDKYKGVRNIGKMNHMNDGTRSLYESIQLFETITTLEDLKEYKVTNFVLIGINAMSYYVKPMMSIDLDLLFMSKNDVPDIMYNLTSLKNIPIQNIKYCYELKVITPESINMCPYSVNKIFNTAIVDLESSVKIASPEALIVLYLHRFNHQDMANIENLKRYKNINLSYFELSDELIKRFDSITLD